jgi:ribosomal protein S27AE
MIKHELRTCSKCGELTTVAVKQPNHALHLILTALTAGIWVIIWLLAILEAQAPVGRVKCGRCK